MMSFLVRDVLGDLIHVRFRDRKRSVAAAPGEFFNNYVVGINPVRRASFQQLHQFLYRESGRKVNKRVNMIGVHIVDFHINTFVFGVIVQVLGYTRCSCFV